MNDEPSATRREFDLEKFATRREFDQLLARVENIDSGGTRGVLVLQQQVIDLTKDVTELKTTMGHKFDEIDNRFEKQRLERLSGRRWLVGIGVAGLASMSAVIGLLVEIMHHVHG